MPKFYFDFRVGDRQTHDSEGLELESAERAKREAMTALSQLLQLEERDDDQRVVRCHVRNDRNLEIYNVSLGFRGSWQMHRLRKPQSPSTSRFSLVSRIMS